MIESKRLKKVSIGKSLCLVGIIMVFFWCLTGSAFAEEEKKSDDLVSVLSTTQVEPVDSSEPTDGYLTEIQTIVEDEVASSKIQDNQKTPEATEGVESENLIVEQKDEVATGNGANISIASDTPVVYTADQIVIDSLKLKPINESDVTGYWYFDCRFHAENDPNHIYECYFTGFKFTEPDYNYVDDVTRLAKDIGAAFLNGQSFDIYDGNNFKNKYGFYFDPIDAEKASYSDVPKGQAGYSMADSELCWAATASNMMQYTNYTTASNEDDIMSVFKNNMTNDPGIIVGGIRWFFNGINDTQKVENGKVVYNSTSEKNAQQKIENTGNINSLLATDQVVSVYELTKYSPGAIQAIIANNLDQKNAVGLTLGYYNETERKGGHVITCFGYIWDETNNTIVALFITDSDDEASKTPVPDDVEEKTRKDYLNTLTLRPVTIVTNPVDNITTLSIKGYDGYYLDSVTVLRALANVNLDQEKEKTGTADARTTMDIAITNLYLTKIDEKTPITGYTLDQIPVDIHMELSNLSYVQVNNGNGARVFYVVQILKDGKVIEEIENDITFDPGEESNPMSAIGVKVARNLILKTEKDLSKYEFKAWITKVTPLNNPDIILQEAYTTNNTYNRSCTIDVRPFGEVGGNDGMNETNAENTVWELAAGNNPNTGYEHESVITTVLLICLCAFMMGFIFHPNRKK